MGKKTGRAWHGTKAITAGVALLISGVMTPSWGQGFTQFSPSLNQVSTIAAANCVGQLSTTFLGLQAAAVALDGAGLLAEVAGAFDPTGISESIAVGIQASAFTLSTAAFGLQTDASNQLPACGQDFFGSVRVTAGGLSVIGDSIFNNQLDVTGTLNVSGGASIANGATITSGAAGSVVVDSNGVTSNGNGATSTLNGSAASLLNNAGRGLNITGAQTTLSGGTNASTLTLTDGSTTLSVAGTSGAAKTLFSATTNANTTTSAVTIGEAGNTVNTIQGSVNSLTATVSNTISTGANTLVTDSASARIANGVTTVSVNGTNAAVAAGANNVTVNGVTGTTVTGDITLGRITITGNATLGGATNQIGTIAGTSTNNVSGTLAADSNGIGTNGNTLTVNNAGIRLDADQGVAGNTLTVTVSGVAANGNGALASLNDTNASLLNSTGHGISVNANSTVISGGTTSTTLTLDDGGARFANTQTGGPARVTGVAEGTTTFDAVNFGQLKNLEASLSRGIASLAAIASIPPVDTNKTFALGVGVGHYNSKSAFAAGGSYRFTENGVLKISLGKSVGSKPVVSAGAGFSW